MTFKINLQLKPIHIEKDDVYMKDFVGDEPAIRKLSFFQVKRLDETSLTLREVRLGVMKGQSIWEYTSNVNYQSMALEDFYELVRSKIYQKTEIHEY